MPDDPITADDWFAQARSHMAAAESLAQTHHWQQAYMLVGTALECALKGLVMRRERLNAWPSRQRRPELWTHDLDRLARHSGAHEALIAAVESNPDIAAYWLIAKDYSVNMRYPAGRPFPVRLGRDMVVAAGKGGLLEWLIRLIP